MLDTMTVVFVLCFRLISLLPETSPVNFALMGVKTCVPPPSNPFFIHKAHNLQTTPGNIKSAPYYTQNLQTKTMFTSNKSIFAIFMLLAALAPLSSSAFSLTAILTRRGKPVKPQVVEPSKSLQDFNAQMAAIVAEERRDHYYPYVQQTSAFTSPKLRPGNNHILAAGRTDVN